MKMRSVEFPGEGNRQENAIPTRGKNAKRSPSGTPKPTSGSKPRLWTVKPAPEPYAYWTDPPIARLFVGNQNTPGDRKSTRLNSSHGYISYAVFCLKKKKSER